jgi:hypothetical protein
MTRTRSLSRRYKNTLASKHFVSFSVCTNQRQMAIWRAMGTLIPQKDLSVMLISQQLQCPHRRFQPLGLDWIKRMPLNMWDCNRTQIHIQDFTKCDALLCLKSFILTFKNCSVPFYTETYYHPPPKPMYIKILYVACEITYISTRSVNNSRYHQCTDRKYICESQVW